MACCHLVDTALIERLTRAMRSWGRETKVCVEFWGPLRKSPDPVPAFALQGNHLWKTRELPLPHDCSVRHWIQKMLAYFHGAPGKNMKKSLSFTLSGKKKKKRQQKKHYSRATLKLQQASKHVLLVSCPLAHLCCSCGWSHVLGGSI